MQDFYRELRLTEKEKTLIRDKVFALPHKESLAVYFYFWEQYSYLQIARNLSVPVSEVSKLIQSAKLRLYGEISEVGNIYFRTNNQSKAA